MKKVLSTLVISLMCLPVQASVLERLSSWTQQKEDTGDIVPFTTFDQERLSAQQQLPCKWVTMPQNPTAGYDFLCKGGTWATISYMLDRSPYDAKALGRARLIWRSWHPNAHPSGGEAHTVQPFLAHMLNNLVPARFAQDIEYAFWQGKNQKWHAKDVAVLYSYEHRADHALHRLEVIGRAPKLGMMSHQLNLQPIPQPVPPYALPIQQPQTWVTPPMPREEFVPDVALPQEPIYQVAPKSMSLVRGGPAFLQKQEQLVPDNMLNEAAQQQMKKQHAVPASLEEMAAESRQESVTPAPSKQGASTGSAVPNYQSWPTQPQVKQQSPSNSGIPTLEKSGLKTLDLGAPVTIPAPPAVLLPSTGRNTFSSDHLLEEAERIVPSTPTGERPLRDQLLQEYFEAEATTERYRDRAEGRIDAPLREIEEQKLAPQTPQLVQPVTE